MRIGIDAMGGDTAPVAEVQGALAARKLLAAADKLVLTGRRDAIMPLLAGAPDWAETIEIVEADQAIGMDESPVEALRSKPNSSLARLAELHHRGEVDAMVSAGNTGACVAAAQMRLRRLDGVHRPGIAILTPTPAGVVAICDVGANVNCRPQHLYQYAVMASVYVNSICGVQNPRVGLLSVGTEDVKGNDLVKNTHHLIRQQDGLNFVGNVEGRDLVRGVCDVMICEGIVGNVVLKLMEGMAEGVIRAMVGELAAAAPAQAGAIKVLAGNVMRKYDFNDYGGAPLLGVNGICIICHGASDATGLKNAIRVARDFSKHHVNERITQLLSHG
jgi:phosphate acyltransferase